MKKRCRYLVDQAEIHRKVLSDRLEERNDALFQIYTDFVHISDKEQAWNDLIYLITKDKYRYIPRCISPLRAAIPYVPNKEQVWMDILKLTKDKDECVRYRALQVLKAAYSQISNKEQVCNDLIQLTKNRDGYVRQNTINALSNIFTQIQDSDKERICGCLLDLIKDQEGAVGSTAAKAIGSIFPYVSDKVQLWNVLYSLARYQDADLRNRAAKSLSLAFPYTPDKVQAWNDLFSLAEDKDRNVRLEVAELLKLAFLHVPNKELIWYNSLSLTKDEDRNVRVKAKEALIDAFPQLSSNVKAWDDLLNLTEEMEGRYAMWNIRWKVTKALIDAFPQVPNKEKSWNDLLNLSKDVNYDVKRMIIKSFKYNLHYVPNKELVWKDLLISTNENDDIVALGAVKALGVVFPYVTDKDRAWGDLLNLVKYKNGTLRRVSADVLINAFPYVFHKEKASNDLLNLTKGCNSDNAIPSWWPKLTTGERVYVTRKALEGLKYAFVYISEKDKVQAWKHIFNLIKNNDGKLRLEALETLGYAFPYHPDKKSAWSDLRSVFQDDRDVIRLGGIKLSQNNNHITPCEIAKILGLVFPHIPNKKQAWGDLHKLTRDKDENVRWCAVEALSVAFLYVPDKERQAWNVLLNLTKDENRYVRANATKALGVVFPYVLNKEEAWKYLDTLIKDEDDLIQLNAVGALEPAFSHIPDKKQAWEHLHRLTNDEVAYVRLRAVKVIGAAYLYITDKEQAWTDMLNLAKDSNNEVKASANYSLGRVSIIKATEVETDEKFRVELEKALRFFEKSATEITYSNPANFCHPFYRSFYVLTFKNGDFKAEVQKYLTEAKNASEGSKSKKELLEAIENLANALKEAEKTRDLGTMKCDLSAYKRYCDQAGELLNDTEEKAPRATKLIRKGLPVIDRRIKDLLEEIKDESDNICKTAGREEAEIGCEVRKHTNAALATDNPVEVDRELNYVLRRFDIWSDSISDEKERSYIKDTIADAKNENILGKAKNVRILVGELMKDSRKYVITGSKGVQIIEGNGNVQNMSLSSDSPETSSQNAEKSKKQVNPKTDRIPYLSVLESEIYDIFSSIYQKLREEGASEVNSKTLELLKYKLFDLTTSDGDIRWLDVGCGDGRCLEVLDAVQKREPIKYHGIDGAHKHLDEAEKRAQGYGLQNPKFEKMDAAAMNFDSEYDVISSVLLFHEVDPLGLPFVLKNMVQALKDDGTIVISDFQEPYEREKHVVVWTAEDIEHLFGKICKEARVNIEPIPAGTYPEDLGFYRGYVRKSEIDKIAFDEFMLQYDEFLMAKKEASKQKREDLRGQIRDRVCEILGRSDVDAKNLSEEDMDRIKGEIEEVYGIKAYKIDLFASQIEFLDDKIDEFRNGAR